MARLVFCVDEISQIRALDRAQALLPACPGKGERDIADYLPHGTTNLLGAFNFKADTVIGGASSPAGAVVPKCLETVYHQVADRFVLHMIIDNYGAYTASAIKRCFYSRTL